LKQPRTASQIISIIAQVISFTGARIVGLMEINGGKGAEIMGWLIAKLNSNRLPNAAKQWMGRLSSRQDGGTMEEYIYLWENEATVLTLDMNGIPGPTSLIGVADLNALEGFMLRKGWNANTGQQLLDALEESGYLRFGTYSKGSRRPKTKKLRVAPDQWQAINNKGDGNVWKPVARQQQGQYPTWIMQPDPNGGGQVLGAGPAASISFDISGIITSLPQGLTFAYVSYSNVPGYDDGFFALEILKVDPVQIVSFSATPSSFSNATGPSASTLAFEVLNASYIHITNTTYARAITGSDFKDSAPVQLTATTTFTLVAGNYATGQQITSTVTVAVSPDLFSIVPKGTIVMWSGSTLPNGWLLCDGTNGTPNLVNNFVMGAGLAGVNQTGGAASHTHQASGTVTVQGVGDHSHGIPDGWYGNMAGGGDHTTVVDRNAQYVGDTTLTQASGAHTHDATTAITVQPASSLPPYWTLAFIMKNY